MKKWTVLLTSCVVPFGCTDIDEITYRKNIYLEQISKWLDNTPLNIFVVESSGFNFSDFIHHERLHCITFTFESAHASSSQYEAISIMHAIDYMNAFECYQNCTHILKVTARYYLENIMETLDAIPMDEEINLFLQIHRNDSIQWQNSEYYGISRDKLYSFVHGVKDIGYMEHELYDYSTKNKFSFIGPFPNKIARGGDKLTINPL